MSNAAVITPNYFETGDVAHELDCSATYVRALVTQGRIRPVATTARGVALFDPDDVRRLAEQRRQQRDAR